MAIAQRAVELHLEPVVAIAGRQSLVEVHVLCGVLLRALVAAERYIPHLIAEAKVGEGVHVPVAGRVERRVEHQC